MSPHIPAVALQQQRHLDPMPSHSMPIHLVGAGSRARPDDPVADVGIGIRACRLP